MSDGSKPVGVPALGALLLLAVVICTQILVLIGSAGLRVLGQGGEFSSAFHAVQGDLLSVALAQLVAMGSAVALGLWMFDPERPVRQALHVAPVGSGALALCFLAGLGLQFPLNELSNLLRASVFGPMPIEQQLRLADMLHPDSPFGGAVAVVAVVGVAPIMEELLFRGHLTFGLRHRYGDTAAVIISAALFGVCHLDATATVYALVAGLAFGQLALTTTSVLPGIALHAGINAMPLLLPPRLVPIPGFNLPAEDVTHTPWPFVMGGLAWGITMLLWALRIGYVRQQP